MSDVVEVRCSFCKRKFQTTKLVITDENRLVLPVHKSRTKNNCRGSMRPVPLIGITEAILKFLVKICTQD